MNLPQIHPVYQFLFSSVGFVVFNEFAVLPYYIWTPESMMTPTMMSQRNPLIHLSLLLINFGFITLGLKSGEKLFNLWNLKDSLNDSGQMRSCPKKT